MNGVKHPLLRMLPSKLVWKYMAITAIHYPKLLKRTSRSQAEENVFDHFSIPPIPDLGELDSYLVPVNNFHNPKDDEHERPHDFDHHDSNENDNAEVYSVLRSTLSTCMEAEISPVIMSSSGAEQVTDFDAYGEKAMTWENNYSITDSGTKKVIEVISNDESEETEESTTDENMVTLNDQEQQADETGSENVASDDGDDIAVDTKQNTISKKAKKKKKNNKVDWIELIKFNAELLGAPAEAFA